MRDDIEFHTLLPANLGVKLEQNGHLELMGPSPKKGNAIVK